MTVPIVRHPGRLAPIPPDKVESLLPTGNVLTVRRIYPAAMQPDSTHKWTRDFLLDRIREHGAFFAGSLQGTPAGQTTVGIPATDGGFLYVVNDPPDNG